MQKQDGNAAQSLLLRTERQNLIYVLAQAELTEKEQTALKDRLAIVEDELVQVYPTDIPW